MNEYQSLAKTIQIDPLRYLSAECVIVLRAFLGGYHEVYGSLAKVDGILRSQTNGPSNADAFTCALLESSNAKAAFYWSLEKIIEIPPAEVDAEVRNRSELKTLVEMVREPIESQRYGLIFGEPTVSWLHNFQRGYHFALSLAYPSLSNDEEQAMVAFEEWLQTKYCSPQANWATIVRVFKGPCSHGLDSFVELFDEFSHQES